MCQQSIHPCHHCNKPVKRDLSVNRKGQKSDKIFCNRECYDQFRTAHRKSKARYCQNCGNIMDMPSASARRKYCSMDCKNQLAAKKALTQCKVCGVTFTAIKWLKGNNENKRPVRDSAKKLCSRLCLSVFMQTDEDRKLKTAHHGKDHPNWQGGTHKSGSRGHGWLALAEKVRERAGRKCEHCGKPESENGRKLDVNHIEPFHQHRNKTASNRMSNLEALCRSCHIKADSKWRRENPLQKSLSLFMR